MSSSGPTGPGDDPFQAFPFLADLARMIGAQGPVAWDAAVQLATSVATEGRPEPNVDPAERMAVEQLARVAELQVGDLTSLPTAVAGRALTVTSVNRSQWVRRTVDDYKPLFEELGGSLSRVMESQLADDAEADPDDPDPLVAMGGFVRMLGPVLVGMTAGSMVGHLATRAFGQYDLPVPRPARDDLLLVAPNIEAFAADWSLPLDDLRLWVCVSEVAHHAVLGVPHMAERLRDLTTRFVGGFEAGSGELEARLGEIDPAALNDPGRLQELLGQPDELLSSLESPAQRELRAQADVVVAVVEGVVDWVVDRVGERLLSSGGQVTEAMRRRRVETDQATRMVQRLFGLELTQDLVDTGAGFVDGVVERAGAEALGRLWDGPEGLPTAQELQAPGVWLARLGVEVTDVSGDLDLEIPDYPDLDP